MIVTIVSKLVYNLFTGRNQPTYIGAIINLLSTMDTPVGCSRLLGIPALVAFARGDACGIASMNRGQQLNLESALRFDAFS